MHIKSGSRRSKALTPSLREPQSLRVGVGPHSPLFFSLLTSGSARPELLGTRQGRMLRTLPQPPGPPHTLPPPGHWGKARLHPCPVVRGLEANHLAWPPAPESGCRMGTALWVQQVPGPRAPPRGTRTTSAPTCQARGHKLSKRGAHGPRPSGPQGCEGAGSRDGRPNGRRGAQAPGTGCWQGFWSNLSKIVALGGGGAGGGGGGGLGRRLGTEPRARAPNSGAPRPSVGLTWLLPQRVGSPAPFFSWSFCHPVCQAPAGGATRPPTPPQNLLQFGGSCAGGPRPCPLRKRRGRRSPPGVPLNEQPWGTRPLPTANRLSPVAAGSQSPSRPAPRAESGDALGRRAWRAGGAAIGAASSRVSAAPGGGGGGPSRWLEPGRPLGRQASPRPAPAAAPAPGWRR